MKANTRLFGEIDIADDKIISLEDGMIGLPEYRNFALIFDEEKEKDKSSVMWFQSMDWNHITELLSFSFSSSNINAKFRYSGSPIIPSSNEMILSSAISISPKSLVFAFIGSPPASPVRVC